LSENAKHLLGLKDSFVGEVSEMNSLLNLNQDLAKLQSSKIETKQIEKFDTQIVLPDDTKNWFRIVVEQEFKNNILVKLFGSLQNIQGYKESELKEKKLLQVSAYPSKKLLSIYFRDTTDKKAIVEDLRTQIEKFEILSETGINAVWDLDIQNNSISWGPGLKQLFGYDPKEFRDSEQMWLSKIHPEERERIQISFETSLRDLTADHWKEPYRLMKSDGAYISVLDRGTIIRDDRGKALRVVGSLQDISDIKK